MIEPLYSLHPTTGQLIYKSGREIKIIGETDLAVVYTADPECPCLHKHGPAHLVRAYADKLAKIDPDTRTVIVPWTALKNPLIGPAVLDEVNACIAISGRVGRLPAQLGAIAR